MYGTGIKESRVKDGHGWNAIKVARLYNEGKATKEELGAARAAAWDAAWGGVWDAAWGGAWDAARDARDTARDTRDAARGARAEIKWQKRHLKKLLKPLFEEYNPKLVSILGDYDKEVKGASSI